MNWRKLRIFIFTVLALCLIPATRFHQFDEPLLRWLRGGREIDPLTLHVSGEFMEDNLGASRNPDGSVTVRMIAEQYLFIPHCVVVPAGALVHLRVTSADAVHSLALNGTQYKVELLPGTVSVAEWNFPRPGEFKTMCGEFCGAGHYAMRSEWKVIPQEKFKTMATGERQNCGTR